MTQSLILRGIRRSDEVSVQVAIRNAIVLTVLEPVALVCGIVLHIRLVQNIELN